MNQFPMVSLSFIRREILALEAEGMVVDRFSIRRWTEKVVDTEDLAEQAKTSYLLDEGTIGLLTAVRRTALARPRRFANSLRMAVKLGWMSNRGVLRHLAYLAEACVLLLRAEEREIRHIHAHFSSNPAAVALLCRNLGGPSYSFTVHGPHEFDVAAVQGFFEKIGAAAFVVAISNYCRSQLYRWTSSRDWPKIKIVHCGVDERYLAEPPPVDGANATFVCVGRLCEQKGQLLLVDAFTRVRNQHPHARLRLVGDGEMREAIQERIASLGQDDHVTITGWMDSRGVYDELVGARALVMPSFAEGLPVVIMEALAVARPVITTFIAGIPELVRPNDNGWLVPAGDVNSLAKAIDECMRLDVKTIAEMGERGRAAVLEQYNVVTEARRLLEFIQTAINDQ